MRIDHRIVSYGRHGNVLLLVTSAPAAAAAAAPATRSNPLCTVARPSPRRVGVRGMTAST